MVKSEAKYRFGGKLRSVRERKGKTLKEVAKEAKVSESLVSQIERNKVSPSIDTLLTLADVLEIDLEYLFKDYKQDKNVTIVRSVDQNRINLNGVTYQQLSKIDDPAEKHSLEAFILEVGIDSEKGDLEYGHSGKELGVILEGEGELQYGSGIYPLNVGDSVTFDSNIPHILKNTGKSVLKAFWVITPSRMQFSG